MVQEWADEVFFARVPVYTTKDKKTEGGRVRAIGQGERIIYTSEAPTHAAKRRIQLPDQLPLDWSEYQKHWPAGNVPAGNIKGIVVDGHSKQKETKE